MTIETIYLFEVLTNNGKNWAVEIMTEEGRVYRHFTSFEIQKEAIQLKNKIQQELKKGRKLNLNYWTFKRLSYGSSAWIHSGGEMNLSQWEQTERLN